MRVSPGCSVRDLCVQMWTFVKDQLLGSLLDADLVQLYSKWLHRTQTGFFSRWMGSTWNPSRDLIARVIKHDVNILTDLAAIPGNGDSVFWQRVLT